MAAQIILVALLLHAWHASTLCMANVRFVPTRDLPSVSQVHVDNVQRGIEEIKRAYDVGSGRETWIWEPLGGNKIRSNGPHDSAPEDAFEERYVQTWLNAVLRKACKEQDFAPFADECAALLVLMAGQSAAGVRETIYRFFLGARMPNDKHEASAHVLIRDIPLTDDALGGRTWGAAPYMARRLMLRYAKQHRPRRILELGAGTGLVGLALGMWMRTQGCPTEIFLTDYHAVVLENLHYNVTRNGLDGDDVGAHVATLDWQHVYETYTGESASTTTAQTLPVANRERSAAYPLLTDDHPFDVILAADCIYDPAHPAWIHAVACKYLAPKKPGNAEPELHLLVPVRSTHLQELDAVYDAFAHPSSPFHVVCEEQIMGTDDFGPITMHRSAFHEMQGHTVEYKYLVIQRS